MVVYQDLLWGFEIELPEHWSYRAQGEAIWFVPYQTELRESPEMVEGHLLLRPEWIYFSKSIESLWSDHVGSMAGVIGAKRVGSAPLTIRTARGYEAEVILPKKENKRLWLGLLRQGPIVMHMVVAHHLKDREWFEPEVSGIISSLRFIESIDGIATNQRNIPLPKDYHSIDPLEIVPDIPDIDKWEAYTGKASAGALQAFYMRELPGLGWKTTGYTPFPSEEVSLGFAKLQIQAGNTRCTIGIMPVRADVNDSAEYTHIVLKWE